MALQNVGKVSEFPSGKIRTFKVDGTEIAVVNIGDKFFAFGAYCPHMGAEFNSGYVTSDNEVVCYMHSSVYSLENGALIDGQGWEDLPLYECKVEGDEVLVGKA
jgi:nitrite reductase/ring-hydroxylating ferredoxin subunit